MKGYFDGIGKPEAEPKAKAAPAHEAKAEPKGVHIHVHKDGGKIHSKIDKGDGLPADEMQHNSLEEAMEAHKQALADAMNEDGDQSQDGDADDQPHGKLGDYLSKMGAC